MASVLCDLSSSCIGVKQEKKKRDTEAEENRRRDSEEKQVRENKDRLRFLKSFEALICSVLIFGMDHINNLKSRSFG